MSRNAFWLQATPNIGRAQTLPYYSQLSDAPDILCHMTQSNAAHVEKYLRESFSVDHEFSEKLEEDPTSWIGHITSIADLTNQVVEVATTLKSRKEADQAARAIFALVGLQLPNLLGIQITGQNGATLHQRDRSSMIGLNHPLGVGIPKNWRPIK